MIPSVDEVLLLAAQLLGDPTQRKFNDAKLQPFFELAYEELTGEMARHHVRKQKRAVTYALPANTTSLTPLTASISNFGELIRMEERPYGSSELYTRVRPVDSLPQNTATDLLHWVEWSDDTWRFIGATQAIQLRITYWDSGAAPTSGSVGIDGSKNFLAYRTAANAGIPAGNVELAVEYDKQARGPYRDGGGGFIHALIQAMVVAEQKVQIQLPAYTAQPYNAVYLSTGLAAGSDGGTSVGAPTNTVITGTIDGANDTFTIPSSPLRMLLYRNGTLIDENTAYTLSGTTITFLPGYIPQTGDTLRAEVW